MMTPRWQNHYAATIFKELLHTIAPLRKFCQATVVVHTGEGETKLNRPTHSGVTVTLLGAFGRLGTFEFLATTKRVML